MEAIRTQREKQGTEGHFEESAAAPLDGVGVGADDPVVPSSDASDWVVKLEQSFNIFATVILFTPAKSCIHTSRWSTYVLFLSAGFGDNGTQGRVP